MALKNTSLKDAVRKLSDICEANDVSCRIACWS